MQQQTPDPRTQRGLPFIYCRLEKKFHKVNSHSPATCIRIEQLFYEGSTSSGEFSVGRLEGRTPRWYRSFQPLSKKGPPRPVPGRPLKWWTARSAGGQGWLAGSDSGCWNAPRVCSQSCWKGFSAFSGISYLTQGLKLHVQMDLQNIQKQNVCLSIFP